MQREKIEEEFSRICSRFQDTKPSIHQTMNEIEKLDSSLSCCVTPLHIKCRCITAVANLECFKPENSLGAEVQVNSLLKYMASSCCVVRALACSLMRVFCAALDPIGQHITTQVTIICKNMMTTVEETLEIKDSGFELCQAIACSSLCCITVHCASIISTSNSVPFVLVTLKSLLGILDKPKERLHNFCYQVVVDGIARVLHVPDLWTFILTEKERQEIVSRVLGILEQDLCCQETQDDVTITKLLQIFDNANVMRTVLKSADNSGKLLTHLVDLLPAVFPSQELPHPLEVRWRAASVVKQFIGLTDPQIDAQDLSAVLDQGCCHSRQVAQLHQIVLQTFKLHLSRLSDSSYNTGQGY